MKSIGLLGASGRMGVKVAALLAGEYAARAALNAKAGRGQSLENLFSCDAVIDFSLPEAGVALASQISSSGKGPALVVASTGWKLEQRKALEEAARFVPVIASSNFSLGVMALLEILKSASPLLDSLGYVPVITEIHHRHKKDSPSGTALSLQRVISPSGPGTVQTQSIRAGEIIGEHEIAFYGPSDVIQFAHSAKDRDIFARGAIEAALWLTEKRVKNPAFHGIIPVETFFSDFKAARAPV